MEGSYKWEIKLSNQKSLETVKIRLDIAENQWAELKDNPEILSHNVKRRIKKMKSWRKKGKGGKKQVILN